MAQYFNLRYDSIFQPSAPEIEISINDEIEMSIYSQTRFNALR